MEVKLTDFFNKDFVNYASYDNTRKIASCIDGLKSGSRKVAYTVLEKNIREPLKVSQLASKVAEFAEYLHGSLDGVIVTLGQDYCGTNNLPLLQKKGNFGTRFTPEASASRYIFASGSEAFFKLFNTEDTPVLEHQTFEGSDIEPKFYVPSLPVILINGSEGVSSGFAQKILPRNPEDVKKVIIYYIKTGKTQPLVPWFKDFNGTVEQGENPKQWLIKGVIKRIAPTKVQIEEIPVGYDLKGYIKVLDDLQESGTISDYKDLSDSSFNFVVTMPKAHLDSISTDELLGELKLIKKVTENYTCMSEDNSIIEFDSVDDIIKHFVEIKRLYTEKRKAHTLGVQQRALDVLGAKIKFLKLVIAGKLRISKRPQADIEADLTKHGFEKIDGSWDYLLGQKIWNLTEAYLAKLEQQQAEQQQQHDSYNAMTPDKIWVKDIVALKL